MKNFTIKTATDYKDAVIISRHIADIWKDRIDQAYYDKMAQHIAQFNDGYIIGYFADKPIASSIAFPIDRIPSFEEINAGNIYDFFKIDSKYYYIHILQVIEEYRNRGFGITLLRHQIETARNHKYRTIIGMSIDRELSLWKKCGFRDFGKFGFYKNYGRMKWIRMNISE
jgi:GNAT superfamily N-acetyltransferase